MLLSKIIDTHRTALAEIERIEASRKDTPSGHRTAVHALDDAAEAFLDVETDEA